MPRRKVKLQFITDYNARKNSFKKRKEGLKKKLIELSTLCSVDACAILYSPYKTDPDLWPSEEGVENVLEQLRSIPEMEQTKKLFDHDDFIKRRIKKTEELLKKQTKEKQAKEMANKMSACLSGELSVANLTISDLNDIVSFVHNKVSEIESRIEFLKKGVPEAAAPPESQPPQPHGVVGGSNTDNHMTAGGVNAEGYVPVVENPGITFDGIKTTDEWLPADWIDDMGEDFGSFSRRKHEEVVWGRP